MLANKTRSSWFVHVALLMLPSCITNVNKNNFWFQ